MDVLQKGQTGREKFKVRNKQGSNFPAFYNQFTHLMDDNKYSCRVLIGISSDITEEKLKTGSC